MTVIPSLTRLIMSTAGILVFSAPGSTQRLDVIDPKPGPVQTKHSPKLMIRCLPPGGSGGGVPCDAASAETTLEISADQDIAAKGAILRFRPMDAGLGKPIDIPLGTGKQKQWHVANFKLPREQCSKGSSVQFEIQMLTSEINQGESAGRPRAESLGFFQMRC